jgi:TolB protein
MMRQLLAMADPLLGACSRRLVCGRLVPAAAAVPLALVVAFAVRPASIASADTPAPASTQAAGDTQADESVLGTVEANGSANGLPPLPKLALVPIVTTGMADSIVTLVVRRDLELSGQFDVLPETVSPPGPFTHTSSLDLAAWKGKGAEFVVRVYSQPAPNDSAKTELVGEAFIPPAHPTAEEKPAFHTVLPISTLDVRAGTHRLVDELLGALTGRPGGFASAMTYTERVGRWRRVFDIDSDGFNLRSIGPADATAISPAFGPGGQIYYALSQDFSPFRLVFGPQAIPVPVQIPGSILGLAFSADHTRLAITSMDAGVSQIWMGDRGNLTLAPAPPFANHPVFGPLGKVAMVAGNPVQRVYIDGKPISPAGFMASAPVFCDTPEGLLVIYTVGVGAGTDIIATDTNGGSMHRLTQHEGANTYAACSPDGRLVSFFSTGKRGQGAGLFVMPIARPWLAKKISSEVGDALRWEKLSQGS